MEHNIKKTSERQNNSRAKNQTKFVAQIAIN